LADVPVITSEAGKSRGSGDPFFVPFFIMRERKICRSKVIIVVVVMLCMYIQTQSSTIPLSKRCDVTYPNQVIMKRTMILASLSLFHTPSLLLSFSSLTRVHENERKKEERMWEESERAHLFSVLCCFLVECRSVLAVLVGLVVSSCVSRYQRS
jgi:hypothetical protein